MCLLALVVLATCTWLNVARLLSQQSPDPVNVLPDKAVRPRVHRQTQPTPKSKKARACGTRLGGRAVQPLGPLSLSAAAAARPLVPLTAGPARTSRHASPSRSKKSLNAASESEGRTADCMTARMHACACGCSPVATECPSSEALGTGGSAARDAMALIAAFTSSVSVRWYITCWTRRLRAHATASSCAFSLHVPRPGQSGCYDVRTYSV